MRSCKGDDATIDTSLQRLSLSSIALLLLQFFGFKNSNDSYFVEKKSAKRSGTRILYDLINHGMSRGKGAFPFLHQMRFEWVALLTSKWIQAMCHNLNFVPFFRGKNCEISLNESADQSRALQRSGNICIYFYSRFKSKHI